MTEVEKIIENAIREATRVETDPDARARCAWSKIAGALEDKTGEAENRLYYYILELMPHLKE